MTKKEARALIACGNKITRALDACLNQLSDPERDYARVYWAQHIKNALYDGRHGAAPMERAAAIVDAD